MSSFETLELTADEKRYVTSLKQAFNDVACKDMPTPLALEITKRRDLPSQIEDKWNPYDGRPYFNVEVSALDKPSAEIGWVLMHELTQYGGMRFNLEPHLTFNMRQYSVPDLERNGSALLVYTPWVIGHVNKRPKL